MCLEGGELELATFISGGKMTDITQQHLTTGSTASYRSGLRYHVKDSNLVQNIPIPASPSLYFFCIYAIKPR